MDLTDIALLFVVLVLVPAFVLEMYRRMQRTRIFALADGLRFEAYNFTVQIQRQQHQVHIHCARGVLAVAGDGAPAPPPAGVAVDHVFSAVGFTVEVCAGTNHKAGQAEPVPTGYSDIVFKGADGTQLTMERVSNTVASNFQYFFLQVHRWIVKLEQRLERERVSRLRGDAEAANTQRDQAFMAQLLQGRASQTPLSLEEREAMAAAQIAHWRSAAGFKGQHSAHHTDAGGRVVWLVDLADDGRITLHADGRTVHTTLRGSNMVSNNGELEVGVRDAHWSEIEPQLRVFRVLRARSAEERRAWRERLDIMRMGLGS
jgi:hypothetical protein